MIRIAAVGDVHYDHQSRPEMREHFAALSDHADLLLIAGDLTQTGAISEAEALARDLEVVTVPVFSVLGNHDFHSNRSQEIRGVLGSVGVNVLEGDVAKVEVRKRSVGIAGLKGFGGGFFGACVTEFGERETKAFAAHSRLQAEVLRKSLLSLDTEYRFALLHFSPIESTLLGEKREIYPFLGSYLLGEAIDSAGADGAFHGHAHMGVERGSTRGGVPVRNVAQTVIRQAYHVYVFEAPRAARAGAATGAEHSTGIPPGPVV